MDSSTVSSRDSSKRSRIPIKALALVAVVALAGVCIFAVISSDEGFSTEVKTFDVGDFTYEVQWSMATLTKYNGNATHVDVESNVTIEGSNYLVAEIGEGAFSNNRTLESVNIYGTLAMKKNAFRGCTSLSEVHMTGSIRYFGDGAFQGCTSLESIQLPLFVNYYGASLFEDCTSLKTVTFDNKGMILGCISAPLGEDAFKNCSSFEGFASTLFFSEIGAGAFSGCTSLKFLDLNGMSSIGDYAFQGCVSMEKVVLPDSLTSIGKMSFDGCDALNEIQFGKGLESIQVDSFNGVNFFGADGDELTVTVDNLKGSLFIGTPEKMIKQIL